MEALAGQGSPANIEVTNSFIGSKGKWACKKQE
jgi:hypothetical protein